MPDTATTSQTHTFPIDTWVNSMIAIAHDPAAIVFFVSSIVLTVILLLILNHFFDIKFFSVEGRLLPGYSFQRRSKVEDEITQSENPQTPELPVVHIEEPTCEPQSTCSPNDCLYKTFHDDHHKKAILSEHEVVLYNQITYDVIRQMTIDELITTTLYQMNKVERGFRKIIAYFTAEYGTLLKPNLPSDYTGAISQHDDYKNYLNLIELSFNINIKSGIRYALNNNHIPDPSQGADFNEYIDELVNGLFLEHISFMDDRYTSEIVSRDVERESVLIAMKTGVLNRYLAEVIGAAIKERRRIEHKIERMLRDMKQEQQIILYSKLHSDMEKISINGTIDSKESMDTLRVKYNINVGV